MIRILLAHDENLIRSALASLLAPEDDLEVVAQAATGAEAMAAAAKHRPDVALLDLQMPDLDGISVAERLGATVPECRCVIVTSRGRPGYLKAALTRRPRLPAQDRVGHRAGPGGTDGGRRRPVRRPRARRRGDRRR